MSTKTIIFTVKSKHRCGFDVVAEKEEAEEKAKELLRKKAELEEETRKQEEQKRQQQEEIEEMKRKQREEEGEKEKMVRVDLEERKLKCFGSSSLDKNVCFSIVLCCNRTQRGVIFLSQTSKLISLN